MFQNWNSTKKSKRQDWGGRGRSTSAFPRGLRGKQIGLYFRDLNKGKPNKSHTKTITLTIPPSVVTHVNDNLKTLTNLAKVHNINIPHIRSINRCLQKQIITTNHSVKQEPDKIEVSEGFMVRPRYVQPAIIEIKPKTESYENLDYIPIVSDMPENNKHVPNMRKIPKSEPGTSTTTDVMPNDTEKPDNHTQILNKKKTKIDLERSTTPDLTKIKSEPGGDIVEHPGSINTHDSKKPIKTESPDVEIIEDPSGSAIPDFITVNKAEKDKGYLACEDDLVNDRMLSLRGGGDYKYGYEDIIKGSFHEKLDECLSKGVNITKRNTEIDDINLALYEEYNDMLTRDSYKRMMTFRGKLPTYKKSKELLEVINKNQTIVISGETGCGKSTQVPQLILDEAIRNKCGANIKILVTQPRRIAASSLAARVSAERAERIGNSVGYAVRLEKIDARPRGSITFCTTGILLTDLEVNQGLTNYSHVILDEVHERDTHIDLSMCMLKQVLRKRKDLKLILMSATLDAERLSAYFDNCPMMHIEGLAYPVKDIYLEEILQMTRYKLPSASQNQRREPVWLKHRKHKKVACNEMEKDIQYKAEIGPWLESIKHNLDRDVYNTLKDSRIEDLNMQLMVYLLRHICKGEPGAILVFLPGIGEITKLISEMRYSDAFPSDRYQIFALHSKLPTLEQHMVFERPPDVVRKIIIATNIAETSITIDDIVYVVDCGRLKMSGLNVEDNISTLKVEWIAQANLRQRRGRAGRCQPGICYHLVTSYRAQKLAERLLPELQRSNLLEPVLSIKRLRLGKAIDALMMVPDPPAEATINWAVKHLQQCGALNDKEILTPLGWHLARLPLHPAAGKLLLFGALFGCLDRAASVAAVWSFKDPFILVIGKESEINETKRSFSLGEPSDHVAISEAIIQWERCSRNERRSFAYKNFLSNSTLELLTDMKEQLGSNLKNMGFLVSRNVRSSWENRNADNLSLFKAVVAASLYPNIASVKWVGLGNFRKHAKVSAFTPEEGKVHIHPSSMMMPPKKYGPSGVKLCSNPGANWLVYWLKQKSSELFLIDVTLVYTLPLLFFGELSVTNAEDDNPNDCFISITSINVRCKRETADMLFQLRSLLDHVLASKVMSTGDHATKHNRFEELVLNAVTELITAEDEQADYLSVDLTESDLSENDSKY